MTTWGAIRPAPGLVFRVAVENDRIIRLAIASSQKRFFDETWKRDDHHPLITETARQLQAYFRGELREFQLPLELRGTPFQKRVWRELLKIPYGMTRSYAQVAKAAGSPKGFRAVGMANHENPIGIVVPCHRVVAADGSLGGYACGIEFKRKLLDLEAKAVARSA